VAAGGNGCSVYSSSTQVDPRAQQQQQQQQIQQALMLGRSSTSSSCHSSRLLRCPQPGQVPQALCLLCQQQGQLLQHRPHTQPQK
jgi:hypothetical protein